MYLYGGGLISWSLHQAVVFSNPEEELIVAESELCIDYEVAADTDSEAEGGVSWADGVEMVPWRRSETILWICQDIHAHFAGSSSSGRTNWKKSSMRLKRIFRLE
jgi:hypothetical protein